MAMRSRTPPAMLPWPPKLAQQSMVLQHGRVCQQRWIRRDTKELISEIGAEVWQAE